MTAPRLHTQAPIAGPATPPGYTPAAHGVGIVHLGVGAFHRAHQAVMTDDALAASGGDWRITGVSLRSKETAEQLNAQNGLFTLVEQGTQGTTARVIGSIAHVIAANPAETLAALCDPAIKVVTLTVTEKGYGIDLANRQPDPKDPAVAADLSNPEQPIGVLGLLVKALERRRDQGIVPFTVLSCDNLPENGALVRDGVIGFARALKKIELANWIAETVAFPSSMVDRITPAATEATRSAALELTGCDDGAAIETEPFIQWVIEDHFPNGRPNWEAGGALFVPEVTPYEQMKLTMLNGTHSMLAYAGFLSGCTYVRDVMADAALSALVKRHLAAAAALLKPLPGVDFGTYAAALADRFVNPSIAHETFQIATDGSQKLPQRIFQPAIHALESGSDLRPFAFAAAMWMRFCLGQKDEGPTYSLRDPRADELKSALATARREAEAISAAFHGISNLIPARLAKSAEWRDQVSEILTVVLNAGVQEALRQEVQIGGLSHTNPKEALTP